MNPTMNVKLSQAEKKRLQREQEGLRERPQPVASARELFEELGVKPVAYSQMTPGSGGFRPSQNSAFVGHQRNATRKHPNNLSSPTTWETDKIRSHHQSRRDDY